MWASLLATLWRVAMLIADYRGIYRWLSGQPPIDVAIITNVRDETERHLFWGNSIPKLKHSNGAKLYLNGVCAQVRGIYITSEEMLTKQGRYRAKQYFINAVYWSQRRGAKVVLLAASTKRLFGRHGEELKQLFPDIVFTIGDNGTASLLCQDVDDALAKANLQHKHTKVLVIGAYGILGTAITEHLLLNQVHVLAYGANKSALHQMIANYGIKATTNIHAIGRVDAVITCTHSAQARLNREAIELLRKHNRKLLVIDVAEPANFDEISYKQCLPYVIRQDAGNAYSPLLHYVLGGISSNMLNLSPQVVFGCFAEAMALYHAIYHEHNAQLLNKNWFEVNSSNRALIKQAFDSVSLSNTYASCFNVPVRSFDLALTAQCFNQAVNLYYV